MNANRNLVVDFHINHRHDHYVGKDKHNKDHATKPKRRYHK